MTAEEWDVFCHKLGRQENIYDLLVLLYLQVEGLHKPQYFKEYYERQNTVEEGYWGDLRLINNELLTNRISFAYYLERFKECINREKLRNVAVRMLIEFDTYFREREKYPALELEQINFTGNVYHLGPLNNTETGYGLYLMPDCHYFTAVNREKELGIRYMDKSGFTKIDERIIHYKIVKEDRLDKRVRIKYYGGTGGIVKTYPELRIGIVPVAKELWCKEVDIVYEKSDKYYFRLEDVEESSGERNEAYVRVLQKCMENRIQIVVFPELARNKETLKHIQRFLGRRTLENANPLELIFMGSLWEDGKNEGVLLSGTGAILMKSKKMNQFFLKRDGKKYWEDLKEEAQEMELLDVPGIGRIQYLVCKDGLDDGLQHTLWGLFEIAVSFISSYSESVSHFGKLGASFGAEYGGIQVLANACAPRIGIWQGEKEEGKRRNVNEADDAGEEDAAEKGGTQETAGTVGPQGEIGHIILPCKGCDNTGASRKEIYACLPHCVEKCSFCGCIRVFQVNPALMGTDGSGTDGYAEVYPILL